MPINIENVELNRRPVVRKDLSILSKSFDDIDTRHQEALKQRTAIDTALANLELNEAEDSWKTKYSDSIKEKIDSEAQFGNYANALTAATKAASDAFSNPALLGRYRANQEYKKFDEELSKRTDIGEDIKEWSRELNPYKYEDKVDENGRVVGGTQWSPNKKPVSTVDTFKLMQNALQTVAREAGGSETIYYMDENGQFTSDINKSFDGMAYMSKSGKFEAIKKDKLRKAIDSAIAGTPGASESIQQDYEVGIWKTKKQQQSNKDDKTPVVTEVTDNKGFLLTKDQYLNKIVDPFIQSATYTNSFSSVNALQGLSVGAAKLRKKANGGDEKVKPNDITKTNAGYFEKQVNSASGVFAEKNAAKQGLSQIATELGVIVKPTASGESIMNAITEISKRKGIMIPKEAVNVFNEYKESSRKFNELIPPGTSDDQKQAIEFTTALDNGVDLSTIGNNKYANDYIKTINNVFGQSDKIYFAVGDNVKITDVIAKFDGTEKGSHRNLGISTDSDNNGVYITLDRKNATNFYLANKIMSEFGQNVGDALLGKNINHGKILRVNDKGNKEPFYKSNDVTNLRKVKWNLYEEANSKMKNFIETNGSTKPVNIPQTAIGVNDILYQYANNLGMKKEDLGIIEKKIENSFNAYQAQMGEMYIGGIGKTRKGIEEGQVRSEIYDTVRGIYAKDPKRVTFSVDERTLGTIITVAPNLDKDASKDDLTETGDLDINTKQGFSLYIPDLVNTEVKNMMLNDPMTKAKNKLYNNVISGFGKTPVGEEDYLESVDGNNYIYRTKNKKIPLTEEQAASVIANNEYLNNLRYNVQAIGGEDKLTEDQSKDIINTVINNYKSIYGLQEVPFKELPNFVVNQITEAINNINKPY